MKTLALLALAAATVLGVTALADLTQNRPDPTVPGTTTVVEFDVDTNRYSGSDHDAADVLWSVCAATVGGPGSLPDELDAGGFAVSVTPAVGENGRKRLVGCLEDGTLDRVQGHVLSVTDR